MTVRLHTIASHRPFLGDLAAGLWDLHGGRSGEGLAGTLLLLPTRRAVRAMGEAFRLEAERRGRQAVLLPRMRTIGDIDEEELILDRLLREEAGTQALDLPRAMPEMRRLFLLARLVARWQERVRAEAPEDRPPLGAAQIFALARELGRFLDLAYTEGARLDSLADIVPDTLAHHWALTVEFLRILSEHWPAILEAEQAIDPADRRNRLIGRLAESWTAAPPAFPVIAAGSTGSIPATARLLAVIARLPQGAVVLPGLDTELDRASWEAVGTGHAQAAMKSLLERMGVGREVVLPWTEESRSGQSPRSRLVSEALRPVDTTDAWQDAARHIDLDAARAGLGLIEADGPGEEALAIALLLRETLETADSTAALVTPDRELARRVASELARWDITIDDSAGIPLAQTPPAAFLRLIAQAAEERLAPAPLLAVLRHPLAALGLPRGEASRLTSRLERTLLRGVRPAGGIAGLRAALAAADLPEAEYRANLAAFIDRIEAGLGPFLTLLAGDGGAPPGR
ncbi:MAG: double-strand break repair protein AddB, partial [Alphaproteobacteria bacterium]|nr:double-strand break repair protein AddB [Alphaproteobacteria bacterium]